MYLPPAYIEPAYYRFYAFVQKDRLVPGWSKKKIIETLADIGIPCQGGSCSEIYLEKAFVDAKLQPAERLPTARQLDEEAICFPVHPALSVQNVEDMADRITFVLDRKSTRLNSSHIQKSRMPSSA